MGAEPVRGPEPLNVGHRVESFECGVPSLDRYLAQRALSDQAAEKSRTYVVCRADRIVGYFSLAAANIEPAEATLRAAAGQGTQPIPSILLARLAIARDEQGNGIGEALLVEALTRCAQAADTIGARVVLVHAVSDDAKAFYLRYGFEASPTSPLHLVMLMKDIRTTLRMRG